MPETEKAELQAVGVLCAGCGFLFDLEEIGTQTTGHHRQVGPSDYEQCGPLEDVCSLLAAQALLAERDARIAELEAELTEAISPVWGEEEDHD